MDIVTHIVKYNSATNGREKLCRFAGYAARLALSYTRDNKPDIATKLKNLEKSLSATRKVLKFGKSLDMIQSAVASLSLADPVIRLTLVMAKLNQAVYLILDHYVWLTKIEVVSADPKKLVRIAAIFWLTTLFFNLIRNVHDIINIISKNKIQNESAKHKRDDDSFRDSGNGFPLSGASVNTSCFKDNAPVILDVTKNVTDLFLPLAALRLINMPEAFLACMGMTSSFIGIVTMWKPSLKLRPS